MINVLARNNNSANHKDELLTVDGLNRRRTILSTHAMAAHLDALDAIYFSIVTLTTLGYGDIPVYDKKFTSFFVLLGAGMVGTFFGLLTGDLVDQQEVSLKSQFNRVGYEVQKLVRKSSKRLKDFHAARIAGLFRSSDDESDRPSFQKRMTAIFTERLHIESVTKIKNMNLAVYENELRELQIKGIVDGLFILIAIFSGSIGMILIEGWTFNDSIYWACVTITTVGYGDVTPKTKLGKVFTILYVICGSALAAKGFRDLIAYPMLLRAKENEMLITSQFGDELSEKSLNKILYSEFFNRIPNLRRDNKEILKSEFVILMLHIMGKLEDKDVVLASKLFDRMDVECDGVLSEENLADELSKARDRDRQKQLEKEQREAELRLQQADLQRHHTSISDALITSATGAVSLIGETASKLFGSPIHTSYHEQAMDSSTDRQRTIFDDEVIPEAEDEIFDDDDHLIHQVMNEARGNNEEDGVVNNPIIFQSSSGRSNLDRDIEQQNDNRNTVDILISSATGDPDRQGRTVTWGEDIEYSISRGEHSTSSASDLES
eukprot:gene5583-7708_t